MSTVATLAKARDIVLGKTYELTLTRDYCKAWGMPHAMRELIQNALDSDSPFVYEFRAREDGGFDFYLNSQYATLRPETLLLGMTSKADDADMIGQFGEGYKIALLVLTRDGFDVDMVNGDMLWKPKFRHSRTFGTDVLVIDESYAPGFDMKGLTFIVRNLTTDDCDQVRKICLKMQSDIGEIKQTPYCDILLDRPGELYVGDLYVCQTEFKYGYNVQPKHIELDRDRSTVANWRLAEVTTKAWIDTNNVKRVAEMAHDNFPDVGDIRYGCPELVKEECYRLFRERNPGAIVVGTLEEMKAKVEQGMTVVHYIESGPMYHAVTTSKSYIAERPIVAVQTPQQHLQAFYSQYRSDMRKDAIVAFKALIETAKNWKVK